MSRGTLRTLLAALVLLVPGVVLLWAASETAAEHPRLSITFQHLGSFVLASLVIALIFQFWQMRGLIDDMWERAEIVKSLRSARLSRFVVEDFEEVDVQWAQLIEDSNYIGILFSYGRTWRGRHIHQLREFLRDERARLDVVLPDTENDALMKGLGTRFGLPPEEVKNRTEEAVSAFVGLNGPGRGMLSVYAFSRPIVFTCYRFDMHAVLTTYRHQSEKGPIITMVGEHGGDMYAFVKDELDWIMSGGVDEGLTRRIHPSLEASTRSAG